MSGNTINRVLISQWNALEMESLRKQGFSNEELIYRVHEGKLPSDTSKFEFNYRELAEFAGSQPDVFEAAVIEGYRIKYNTIRGIRSWIEVAYGQEAELSLEEGNESVTAVLTTDEKQRLEGVLSIGWVLYEQQAATDNRPGSYRVVPSVRA